jgi:hypothetical protein
MLEALIKKTGINQYTTLVRTEFDNFLDKKSREDDINSIKSQNQKAKEIIESFRGVIYVNNPPTS